MREMEKLNSFRSSIPNIYYIFKLYLLRMILIFWLKFDAKKERRERGEI